MASGDFLFAGLGFVLRLDFVTFYSVMGVSRSALEDERSYKRNPSHTFICPRIALLNRFNKPYLAAKEAALQAPFLFRRRTSVFEVLTIHDARVLTSLPVPPYSCVLRASLSLFCATRPPLP